MATLMMFGLSGLCAWYIAKTVLTGMSPSRYGPDIDLRDKPVSRYVTIVIYGLLMILSIYFGILMLNKP